MLDVLVSSKACKRCLSCPTVYLEVHGPSIPSIAYSDKLSQGGLWFSLNLFNCRNAWAFRRLMPAWYTKSKAFTESPKSNHANRTMVSARLGASLKGY